MREYWSNVILNIKQISICFPLEDISAELLTKSEDAVYLSTELQSVQTNIARMLHSLGGKLPPEDIDRVVYACKKVFEGNRFDDILFNEFIESFI